MPLYTILASNIKNKKIEDAGTKKHARADEKPGIIFMGPKKKVWEGFRIIIFDWVVKSAIRNLLYSGPLSIDMTDRAI